MNRQYGVITGDVVGSTRLDNWTHLLDALEEMLSLTTRFFRKDLVMEGEIFQGDGVQAVVASPKQTLRIALFMRSALCSYSAQGLPKPLDMRIALGLGPAQELAKTPGTSSGDAFVFSGRTLKEMHRNTRIRIVTPDERWNQGLTASCALLDELSSGWTQKQHHAAAFSLAGMTQQEIGDRMKVNQPTVGRHLQRAGMRGVKAFVEYFEQRCEEHLS